MKYVSNSLRYAVKKWNLKLGLESGKTKLQLRPVNLHTILNIEPYETSESQHKMLRGRGRGGGRRVVWAILVLCSTILKISSYCQKL